MVSKTDLINDVLTLVGALDAGQTASAEDVELVDKRIPSKLEDLARRGIVYVPDVDDIDDGVAEWVAILLAQSVNPRFGKAIEPDAIALAETMLRKQQANAPTYQALKADYF